MKTALIWVLIVVCISLASLKIIGLVYLLFAGQDAKDALWYCKQSAHALALVCVGVWLLRRGKVSG